MNLQDVIQKTLGAHGSWAWDDILDTECRIHCVGCGKALGALDEDVHSQIQSMQGDALHNAHQAEKVYEALTKSGGVEWGYRAPGYKVTASAYEELARDMAEHVGGPVASRMVGPWVEES